MKTVSKLIFASLLLISIISCKIHANTNDYLRKVLNNLEKIESATYFEDIESWEPGDSIPTVLARRFIKEYNNPMDSTIGANFMSFNCDDTTKLESCYDGKVKALINDDVKGIEINDFTFRQLPFRLVTPPFFNYAKNIIRYTLTTKDSITVSLKDCGDNYYFKLVINEDRQVEFFGKAHYMPEPPFGIEDPTSIYELWISKSNDLPYKTRREMSHNISVSICSDTEINKLSIDNFSASDYFPKDYEIRKYGDKRKTDTTSQPDLTNKLAPNWILNDINEQPVSLTDLKSKVLLINFTGIGCGPCHAAIPFLNKLKDHFSPEEVGLVAIESWGRKTHSLQNYVNRNKINYQLLEGSEDIIKCYQARAVPIFFILDKQRIIRKVIKGYSMEATDKEIMNAIKELL